MKADKNVVIEKKIFGKNYKKDKKKERHEELEKGIQQQVLTT